MLGPTDHARDSGDCGRLQRVVFADELAKPPCRPHTLHALSAFRGVVNATIAGQNVGIYRTPNRDQAGELEQAIAEARDL